MTSHNRVEIHVRIRPPVPSLNEAFQVPAARKHGESAVCVAIPPRNALSTIYGNRPPQTQRKASTPTDGSLLGSFLPPPILRHGHSMHRDPTPSSRSSSAAPRKGPSYSAAAADQYRPDPQAQMYSFDHVYDMDEPQATVFEETALEVIDGALREARSSTIMCYGATGSGKTYTMLGRMRSEAKTAAAMSPTVHCELGLLPRIVHTLLTVKSQQAFLRNTPRALSHILQDIVLCAVEIYQEEVRDLLHPMKQVVKLSDIASLEDVLHSFSRKRIDSLQDLAACYDRVTAHRVVCSHMQNDQSSRSHAVFLLGLDVWLLQTHQSHTSCIAMVDLAGSERVKKSNVEGMALSEAQAINKSLSALCTVVHALYQQHSHIPYRDSKLTRLLRPCFEQGHIITIIHIPPSPRDVDETITTLKFAERLKYVVLPSGNVASSVDTAEVLQQIALEEQMLGSQRRLAEAHAELRICNAACGHVIRRIARRPGASEDTAFANTFSVQREDEERERMKCELRDDLVEKHAAPLRHRVVAAQLRLQEAEMQQSQLLSDHSAVEREAKPSQKQGYFENARMPSDNEAHLVQAALHAAKRAKRSRQVGEEVKAKMLEQLREWTNCFRTLEVRIAEEVAPSQYSDTLQKLKTDVQKERARFGIESQVMECIEGPVKQHMTLRASVVAAAMENWKRQCTLDSEKERDERLTAESERDPFCPTWRYDASSASWPMPLLFSSKGTFFTPPLSLLGSYHDAAACGLIAAKRLANGISGTLIHRVPLFSETRGVVLPAPCRVMLVPALQVLRLQVFRQSSRPVQSDKKTPGQNQATQAEIVLADDISLGGMAPAVTLGDVDEISEDQQERAESCSMIEVVLGDAMVECSTNAFVVSFHVHVADSAPLGITPTLRQQRVVFSAGIRLENAEDFEALIFALQKADGPPAGATTPLKFTHLPSTRIPLLTSSAPNEGNLPVSPSNWSEHSHDTALSLGASSYVTGRAGTPRRPPTKPNRGLQRRPSLSSIPVGAIVNVPLRLRWANPPSLMTASSQAMVDQLVRQAISSASASAIRTPQGTIVEAVTVSSIRSQISSPSSVDIFRLAAVWDSITRQLSEASRSSTPPIMFVFPLLPSHLLV